MRLAGMSEVRPFVCPPFLQPFPSLTTCGLCRDPCTPATLNPQVFRSGFRYRLITTHLGTLLRYAFGLCKHSNFHARHQLRSRVQYTPYRVNHILAIEAFSHTSSEFHNASSPPPCQSLPRYRTPKAFGFGSWVQAFRVTAMFIQDPPYPILFCFFLSKAPRESGALRNFLRATDRPVGQQMEVFAALLTTLSAGRNPPNGIRCGNQGIIIDLLPPCPYPFPY